MKEFNLELAKQGKPVCTRDGRSVRILCFDLKGSFPIAAAVEREGDEDIFPYCANGIYYYKGSNTSCLDLCMASEKHEGWINIYPNQSVRPAKYTSDSVFDTEEKAKQYAGGGCIATVKIEWEE